MSTMRENIDYKVCSECGATYTIDKINNDTHEKKLSCNFKCNGRSKCTLNADPKCNIHN